MSIRTKADTAKMALRMKTYKAITLHLDEMYQDAEHFGAVAAEAFGRERGKAQLKNLENIANSTRKWSDVMDYIKRQTSRVREWKKEIEIQTPRMNEPGKVIFGLDLLKFLRTVMKSRREKIITELSLTNEYTQQELYLLLIRGFIKQLIIHFEWRLEEKTHATH